MTGRRLVLFDIDGTLLHSGGAGRRAIRAALRDWLPDDTVFGRVRFDGKTDPQIVAELLAASGDPEPAEPARIAAVCLRYVEALEVELAGGAARPAVYPGVMELLARLEVEAGVVLGLLTGNIAAGAALKLRSAGLDPARFRLGAYGSDSAHRPDLPAVAARRAEPHFGREPRGAEVVIVGDTPADVTCGRGIGARAIGVGTGSYGVAELRDAGAHAAFATLEEVDAVLESILG
ncbi:MAG TPA: HAD family hydrolase [Gemmatimonadales bacterium]|nr:HAD family hydrolase [Gemmatimonadales bacterium]